jgi:molecular chaperone IbpA
MVLNFTDPFLTTRVLGFENLFDRLQRFSDTTEKSSSYPPYNIRRDGNQIFIDVAVAGLAREDLNIELAEDILTIEHKGPKAELLQSSKEVVYQGIAQRAFKQQFTLAENVEVHGAELVNGMLTLELEKIIPDAQKPRLIEIRDPIALGSK